MPIAFVPPLVAGYGVSEQVSPLIRRVLAENPSKYSYLGTGTYVVGHGRVAVVDPGPALDAHHDALMRAIEGEEVVAILVTHCHTDHSPLAARLHDETGAPRFGFGPAAPIGDSIEGEQLEESVDLEFTPDVALRHGELVSGPGWTFEAVHTPGHTSNHLCFALAEERALFTGDHVMGWSTTVVTPPDGDMAAYLDSLDVLLARDDDVLWPTHGGPVRDPRPFIESYRDHRLEREQQVLDLVAAGVPDVASIVAVLYADVREELHKAAGRSVTAHLAKLIADGRVRLTDGELGPDGRFALVVDHEQSSS